jgi:hypothetical protein
MVSSQPLRRSSGTKTGARKRTRKMGVLITGPACWVRSIIATPAPKRVAARFTRTANPIRPKKSKPPLMGMPTRSAKAVTSTPVTVTRASDASV